MPGRGRKRKPLELHKLQGTYDASRHKEWELAPVPTGAFDAVPPRSMGADEIEAWQQVVNECPPRVLTNADRAIVELAARSMAAMRREWTAAAAAQCRYALAELGMTPASRSKVKVTPDDKPKDDPVSRVLELRKKIASGRERGVN